MKRRCDSAEPAPKNDEVRFEHWPGRAV